MSDDLVARLRRSRRVWVNGDAMTIIDVDSAYKDFHDAADRIEQLEADLFALAEMVRVISPYVERDINGDVGVVAGRNFYSNSNWTEADAERFQRVLDKLDIFAATYEPEDGERDE